MATTIGDAEKKAPFFKCRKYNIMGKAIEDCEKGNVTIKRRWHLRRILDYKGNPVDDPPVNTDGMYFFVIIINDK